MSDYTRELLCSLQAPKGKKCFIPSGNVKIEWTIYIISKLMQATFRGLMHGWRWVLLLCRVSQMHRGKVLKNIVLTLGQEAQLCLPQFQRRRTDTRHVEGVGGVPGEGQRPSCIQICRLCSYMCFDCLTTAEFCDCDSETCPFSGEYISIYIHLNDESPFLFLS